MDERGSGIQWVAKPSKPSQGLKRRTYTCALNLLAVAKPSKPSQGLKQSLSLNPIGKRFVAKPSKPSQGLKLPKGVSVREFVSSQNPLNPLRD